MKTVRLCAVAAGILATCLNTGRADNEFTILGDASYVVDSQPITATAYQEVAPVPPSPDGNTNQPMPSAAGVPAGPGGPYEYMGPQPSGPIVINEGWGDVWTQSCGPWCSLGTIIAGVEGTFLVPVDEPNQTVKFTDLTDGSRYRGKSSPGLGSGVRGWLGLQQNCTGIRARYWYFGNDLIDIDPEVPFNGTSPTFLESYYLRAQTLDLEVFHEFCFPCGTIDASLGARYANLQRSGGVTGLGTVGGVDLLGIAWGANEIEGTGLTGSIGSTHPLRGFGNGCCDSCNPCAPCGLNFFWNFRYSVLWADNTASVLTDASAIVKPPFGAAAASSRDKAFSSMDKDTVSIFDLQLGLEYTFGVCCLPGAFSVRGGVEYQHWDTGDLIARSNSAAFLTDGATFGGQVESDANAHDGSLDLIGFFLGVQYKF